LAVELGKYNLKHMNDGDISIVWGKSRDLRVFQKVHFELLGEKLMDVLPRLSNRRRETL
jgi:hypothetical protein